MEAQVWQEPGLSPGPGTSLWTRLTRPRLLQPLGFRASTVPASASLPRPCSLECSVSYTAQQCAGVLSRGRSLPRVSLTVLSCIPGGHTPQAPLLLSLL